MTDHSRHCDVWRVERCGGIGKPRARTWKATGPTDPCSDYVETQWFDTFVEAMNFAQREGFRARLKFDFDEYLDNVQNPWMSPPDRRTGLDTMCRTFKWWGKYDLADFLENI